MKKINKRKYKNKKLQVNQMNCQIKKQKLTIKIKAKKSFLIKFIKWSGNFWEKISKSFKIKSSRQKKKMS